MSVVREAGEHHAAGRFNEAAFLYEHLLGAVPEDPVVLYLYGTLNSQMKRFGTAITMLERSTQLGGDELSEVWHNLGVAYRSEGHADRAVAAYKRGVELAPDNAELLAMLAGAYVNNGTPATALEWAENALKIEPGNPHARNHKALALMELGKYRQAWPYYRSRFELPGLSACPRPYDVPRWGGERVGTLAIHGEQGIGDEILFMSCFEEVAKRADRVVIECEHRLCKLFERSFGAPCYPSHDTLIKHEKPDAYIAMGDLWSIVYDKKKPSGNPFLKTDPTAVAHWESVIGHNTIGIAWHGGTKGTHQELRNAPLDMWAQLMEPGGSFVSLQYGEDAPAQAAELGIPHHQEALNDLDEFAALVAACSCVVTVCQSAVHFAGGLGVPCYVLTPKAAAWRYCQDMPWYRSVELVRQDGDWLNPFIEVGKRIADYRGIQRTEPSAA